MAGAITELDVNGRDGVEPFDRNAHEHGPVQSGAVPQSLIDKALELQLSVNSGHLALMAAAQSLQYIAKTGEQSKFLAESISVNLAIP